MARRVTAFTDTYLPTVNGVTYTIDLWRRRWSTRHGRMDVVYPQSSDHAPRGNEYPVPSVPLPIYRPHRLGVPTVPPELSDAEPDAVHVHSPFTLGLAGLRLGERAGVPVVASYHTILAGRIDQLLSRPALVSRAKRVCRRYERAFYDSVDLVTAPTANARRYLRRTIGPETEIEVVSNGIDTDLFRPVDSSAFEEEYEIDGDSPLVGYTGRHSPEKYLTELIDATAGMDVTLVLAGDGPSRSQLEEYARSQGSDAVFPGFLEREELPAFYSALDVFAFPGRLETQGLVALEATACGTPVVAVDAGALTQTVLDGETGYHYPPGDVPAFRSAIERTLRERERLNDLCVRRREMVSVDHTLDQLAGLYDQLLASR